MQLDVVIFGGGIAGLWALDELTDRGYRAALLEASQLGQGQTTAAQGIVHGGLKYTLQGLMTRSALNIREMPGIWRDCLAGQRTPDLSGTRIRSPHCYLWRTESLSSRLGLVGARWGLRAAPQSVESTDVPEVLANCPGTVAIVDEPVVSTTSMLEVLSQRHQQRIIRISASNGLELNTHSSSYPEIDLTDPETGQQLKLQPELVVLAAGAGNAELRSRWGLQAPIMQRRPLHMVLVRGQQPVLNGHCVDGAKTRVTITTDRDSAGRTVWQVGGQVAEEGVRMDAIQLIRHTRRELETAIPGLDLSNVEWSTYRVDRAEGQDEQGRRPDAACVVRDGRLITVWPTKMALAPVVSAEILQHVKSLGLRAGKPDSGLPTNWPRPGTAEAPWNECREWLHSSMVPVDSARAA